MKWLHDSWRHGEGRNDFLDALKGVGIIFVTFGHVTACRDPWMLFVYSFHIPLFFLVSGMLFKPIEIRKVPNRIIKNYAIPFVFFWVLAIVGSLWLRGCSATMPMALSARALLRTFIFGDPLINLSLWFFPSLALCFLCATFINRYVGSGVRVKLCSIVICMVLQLGVNALGFSIHFFLPFHLETVPMALSFYLLGSIIPDGWWWWGKLMKYQCVSLLLLIVAICLGVLWSCHFPMMVDMHFGKFPFLCIPSSLFGLIAAAIACFYVLKVSVLKNVICYIGQFSIVYFAADASIGLLGVCCSVKIGFLSVVADNLPIMTSTCSLLIRLCTMTLAVPVLMAMLNKMKGLVR